MVLYQNPVVRRKAGEPLLYVFPIQADGWKSHGLAFESVADLERAGFLVGPWRTDEHGQFATLTRPV